MIAPASSDKLNAGNWYLPHPQIAPWVDGFLFELSAFPRGKHDDWVDSWTQAREVLSGVGIVDYSVYARGTMFQSLITGCDLNRGLTSRCQDDLPHASLGTISD